MYEQTYMYDEKDLLSKRLHLRHTKKEQEKKKKRICQINK